VRPIGAGSIRVSSIPIGTAAKTTAGRSRETVLMAGRLLVATLWTFAAAVLTHSHRAARTATWRAPKARLAGSSRLARTRTAGTTGTATRWPAVFADVIEAAQLARLIGHRAVDIRIALAIAARHMDFRARLALADHRLQGQHLGAAFHTQFGLQRGNLFGRQVVALAAQ